MYVCTDDPLQFHMRNQVRLPHTACPSDTPTQYSLQPSETSSYSMLAPCLLTYVPSYSLYVPTYLLTYLLTYLPTYLLTYCTYLSTYTYLPTYLPTYRPTYLLAY